MGHGRRRGSPIRHKPSQEDTHVCSPAPTGRVAGRARTSTLRPPPLRPHTAALPWPIPGCTQFIRFRFWWRFWGLARGLHAVFIRSSYSPHRSSEAYRQSSLGLPESCKVFFGLRTSPCVFLGLASVSPRSAEVHMPLACGHHTVTIRSPLGLENETSGLDNKTCRQHTSTPHLPASPRRLPRSPGVSRVGGPAQCAVTNCHFAPVFCYANCWVAC